MKVLASQGPLRVQAIAGTYVVLLGIDVVQDQIAGSRGFGIERLDHTEGEHRWLPNNLRFDAVSNSADESVKKQWGTNYNPLQTFMWGDYTAKPAHVYTYIVHSMEGIPGQELTPQQSVSLRVKTEQPYHQGVWFNRGVISSQAYAQRFHNAEPKDVANDEAFRWLSRGLEEALLEFIGQAVDNRWQLHGSFYEFRLPAILLALGVADRAGAQVNLIVHEEKSGLNQKAVTDAGIDHLVKRWRTKTTIPHNKFLIASLDGSPVAVWTGSTNITENGIFGQSNVGHSHINPELAVQYLEYWQQLLGDPKPSELNNWVDVHNAMPPEWPMGSTVVFSPHTHLDALDRYAALFNHANVLACGTFPFTLDSRFGTDLPGNHAALRYLLFEDQAAAATASTVVSDPKTVIVAGDFLPEGGLAGWAAELENPFSTNIEYIHTKFLLIDPLGDDPIVVTGSANFSPNSTTNNDENMLIIRGNPAVADIYLTEFMRLFEHYKFRYFLDLGRKAHTPGSLTKTDAKVPLDDTDAWSAKYYDDPGRARQREVMSGADAQ